ncbi:ABC transporter substrate-binding protein [Chromohalobacter nigrandesensis]|uniref:ABC transporter substrate-binding protein n=1 Tax=Chromohalobacter nigrandesensis TaxID=119863 RepID=UPI001FF0EC61|nr:ABC transporter substrate-binding protein [Chromohalobacter nigrandesensis]MCK0745204.1 ABC transporter substrate-binding protein [Chromohalobacter nigrandesensis]
MLKLKLLLATSLAATTLTMTAQADDPVKVGIVAPLSGPFSDYGQQFRQAIDAYQAQHGKSVGGHSVEFIYKDNGGPDPGRTRSVAQELIVQEQVDYLGGFVFTPNALAVAPLINKAKTPAVIFNAATSAITQQSDYFVRTSYTTPQVSVPVAVYAKEEGIDKVVTLVTDYGPGIDAEQAFAKQFEKDGGEILRSVRMPMNTTDFGPFVQGAKSEAPDAIYVFLPGGPPTYGFVKAYADNGLMEEGIRFLGTAETQELDLQTLGSSALGLHTGFHYSQAHDSPENQAFLDSLHSLYPDAIANWASVGAYDGAHVIYKMIEATGGEKKPEAAVDAVKGLSWISPRGPMMIDSDYRSPIQNVYMRKVVKGESGELVNKEFKVYEEQPDYGRFEE